MQLKCFVDKNLAMRFLSKYRHLAMTSAAFTSKRNGLVETSIEFPFNPCDVQNNLGNLQFGQFFSSLGTSVRGKFEIDY
jgi:hypothetical protein